ncbi:von Willebrand factor type D domain-containing protein [Krasilnikovia cinnamomea]|uniref:von Willebrand factor type D domain-containing protein n=1 Tax=Krasilnikovia cinnamomea TaxID=349313 RepID=A0A4Q7ZF78_9ACTN|nr:VWD domain-containing protein [Krasilnikovia cinnamomea]RZU49377.1 von Willebrand factor type D domain-containing protein [Krasilnikovia cinnamomea]
MRSQNRRPTVLGVVALLTLVASTIWAPASAAQPPRPGRQDWQNSIATAPRPGRGCYTATYPRLVWRPVGCVTAPDIPQPPRRGPRPLVIGNGSDIAARVPSGFISTAIGSFDSVVNVTSESGPIGNTGPSIANAYTLQLNTNFFASTACAGSPNPGCQGWQQFVYGNDGSSGAAFIQYWLLRYNAACPAGAGWNTFSFTGDPDIYCWKNNTGGAVGVPNQPITNLGALSLSGQVSGGGDSVTLFNGATAYSRVGDNAVDAATGWDTAEFNVFGYGGNSSGGGTATFNAGAALTVRTRTIYGGTAAPLCVATGFTAEKNNLSFGTPAPAMTPPGPAVQFVEDTVGGAATNCAAATTIGDVHAHTVAGLSYDFQAVGDFELAQVGPDFEVQARHISGAPTWPNASVNQAVATRMGGTTVAVCGGPRLVVDGRDVQLREGKPLSLPSGVDITLAGGAYVVTDPDGNSVRVTPHHSPDYMDVAVGLGTWPTRVRGLLGNPDNNVQLLEASDGTVFKVPLSFDDLYYRYGDSWRVKPTDSLLAPCGTKVEESNPAKPFFAEDLEPKIRERGMSICRQAGVQDAWIGACTLDVAVLGEKAAAVYVGKPPPVLDGNR